MEVSAADKVDPEHAVKLMYDYDAIVAQAPDPESVEWVFGYGSILFKQGFDAGHSVAGYIEGWRRMFFQQSTGSRLEWSVALSCAPHCSMLAQRHSSPLRRQLALKCQCLQITVVRQRRPGVLLR